VVRKGLRLRAIEATAQARQDSGGNE